MRRAGKAAGAKNLSISAADEDWETVRRNARNRDLPIARYVVELVRRDGGAADAGRGPVFPPAERRELLEGVREIRALLLEGEETASLVRDMQERIAVQFASWAVSMVGSAREREFRAALAVVLGDDRARVVADGIAAEARTRVKAARAGVPTEERQGRLL